MAIPDYQELMLPLLEILKDGATYKTSESRSILAEKLKLTPDELREMLPSRTSPTFNNRLAWARTYLKKAGLIDQEKRGTEVITDLGLKVLNDNPGKITTEYLKQFSGFKGFLSGKNKEKESHENILVETKETPTENLEKAFSIINEELSANLIENISKIDPYKFEQLVVDLLFAMGYGGNREEAAHVTKKSGDGGIDGIINEDRLGLDKIYIQAKKWEGNVTISAVRNFGGTLLAHNAQKGVFITTSDFPKSSIEYCSKIDRTIILINGKRLTELMIEYNIGVAAKKTYVIKDVDSDYFEN